MFDGITMVEPHSDKEEMFDGITNKMKSCLMFDGITDKIKSWQFK